MKKIIFSDIASLQIRKLEKSIQERIIKKLYFYLNYSNPLVFAELLKNSKYGSSRFRIGDYRIIFDIESDKIVILKVGHRKEIYK